jgi:hypothetical protein
MICGICLQEAPDCWVAGSSPPGYQRCWFRYLCLVGRRLLDGVCISGVPRNFFDGGVTPGIFSGGSTNSVEGRENGDLGAVTPSQGFQSICKWVNPVFWLGCHGCIFRGTGNSAQLCQNFGISGGGGFEPPTPPPSVRHWYACNMHGDMVYKCNILMGKPEGRDNC